MRIEAVINLILKQSNTCTQILVKSTDSFQKDNQPNVLINRIKYNFAFSFWQECNSANYDHMARASLFSKQNNVDTLATHV